MLRVNIEKTKEVKSYYGKWKVIATKYLYAEVTFTEIVYKVVTGCTQHISNEK